MSNQPTPDPTTRSLTSRRIAAGVAVLVGVSAGIAVPAMAAGASRGADDRPLRSATAAATVEMSRKLVDDSVSSTVPTTVTTPTVPTTVTTPTVPTTVAGPDASVPTTIAGSPGTTIDDHGRRHGGHGADDGAAHHSSTTIAGSPGTTIDDHGGDRGRTEDSDDDSDDDSGRGRGRGRGGDDDSGDDSSGRG